MRLTSRRRRQRRGLREFVCAGRCFSRGVLRCRCRRTRPTARAVVGTESRFARSRCVDVTLIPTPQMLTLRRTRPRLVHFILVGTRESAVRRSSRGFLPVRMSIGHDSRPSACCRRQCLFVCAIMAAETAQRASLGCPWHDTGSVVPLRRSLFRPLGFESAAVRPSKRDGGGVSGRRRNGASADRETPARAATPRGGHVARPYRDAG